MKKVLLCCLMLLILTGCSANKKELKLEPKYEGEEFYFENLSKDGYAFIVSDDNLIQLNKNGEEKIIIKAPKYEYDENEKIKKDYFISLKNISNNKLYFSLEYRTYEIDSFFHTSFNNKYSLRYFSVDLDTLEVKMIADIDHNHYEILQHEVVYGENLYASDKCDLDNGAEIPGINKYTCKVKKYNLKTKKEDYITIENIPVPRFILVADSRIYFSSYEYNDLTDNNEMSYYSSNLEGKNVIYYTEEEFKNELKNAKSFSDFIPDENFDEYLMSDGKKIFTKGGLYFGDVNELYFGDELIYTAKKGEYIKLRYINQYGKVAIYEAKDMGFYDTDYKYYIIDLKTKEKKLVKESEESDIDDFYYVLYNEY